VGESLYQVVREPVRIVDVPAETRIGVQQDQSGGSVRMRRRREHRHQRPVVGATQRGPLRAGGVEHGQRVAHPLLE
jgi:hypothetical protein